MRKFIPLLRKLGWSEAQIANLIQQEDDLGKNPDTTE